MGFDLVQIRAAAGQKEDENRSFRAFSKGDCDLEPEEIDWRVFEITRRVWARIRCTTCANCCLLVKPSFSEQEVNRLARRLGLNSRQFIESYLERTEPYGENLGQTRTAPVLFCKGTATASMRIAQPISADIPSLRSRVLIPHDRDDRTHRHVSHSV